MNSLRIGPAPWPAAHALRGHFMNLIPMLRNADSISRYFDVTPTPDPNYVVLRFLDGRNAALHFYDMWRAQPPTNYANCDVETGEIAPRGTM